MKHLHLWYAGMFENLSLGDNSLTYLYSLFKILQFNGFLLLFTPIPLSIPRPYTVKHMQIQYFKQGFIIKFCLVNKMFRQLLSILHQEPHHNIADLYMKSIWQCSSSPLVYPEAILYSLKFFSSFFFTFVHSSI